MSKGVTSLAQPAPTMAASAGQDAAKPVAVGAEPAEALVIEGWITVEVEDVAGAVVELGREVEAAGGRVVAETLGGAETSWRATMTLRLPPGDVDRITAWLGERGEVTSKRITASDVSKTLVDQEIALENLRLTLERLRELLARDGLAMADVLAIEAELTRVRGAIEGIEGERRWLMDRVSYATLEVTLGRRAGGLGKATAKLYPGPRLGALVLLDADGRDAVRLGAGLALHIGVPRVSLELDVFEGSDGEDSAVLITAGGAAYSDFLGRGERRFLNPYLGVRLGYGNVSEHAFAAAFEAGVELFKNRYLLLDVNLRGVALIGDDRVDPALVGAASAVFAF